MEKTFIIGKKIAAVSFIVMIFVLNFWVVQSFVGTSRSGWSQDLMYACIIFVFIAGLLMAPNLLKSKEMIEENKKILDKDKR